MSAVFGFRRQQVLLLVFAVSFNPKMWMFIVEQTVKYIFSLPFIRSVFVTSYKNATNRDNSIRSARAPYHVQATPQGPVLCYE